MKYFLMLTILITLVGCGKPNDNYSPTTLTCNQETRLQDGSSVDVAYSITEGGNPTVTATCSVSAPGINEIHCSDQALPNDSVCCNPLSPGAATIFDSQGNQNTIVFNQSNCK